MDNYNHWLKLYGKKIKLTDIDNQTYTGTVESVDDKIDTESEQYEINLNSIKQFPNETVSFREDEIKSIEIID